MFSTAVEMGTAVQILNIGEISPPPPSQTGSQIEGMLQERVQMTMESGSSYTKLIS